MQNKRRLVDIFKQCIAILYGPNAHFVGNALAFTQNVILPEPCLEDTPAQAAARERTIEQVFASPVDGYNKKQLELIHAYAASCMVDQRAVVEAPVTDVQPGPEYLPHFTSDFDTGTIVVRYYLTRDLSEIAADTRNIAHRYTEILKFYVILLEGVRELTPGFTKVLTDMPDYTYRGKAKESASSSVFWCIRGEDSRDSLDDADAGTGLPGAAPYPASHLAEYRSGVPDVLEWCIDEADAQEVLKQMRVYPQRFLNLRVGQYKDTKWPFAIPEPLTA